MITDLANQPAGGATDNCPVAKSGRPEIPLKVGPGQRHAGACVWVVCMKNNDIRVPAPGEGEASGRGKRKCIGTVTLLAHFPRPSPGMGQPVLDHCGRFLPVGTGPSLASVGSLQKAVGHSVTETI